jgi:hypothetical protein
MATTILGTTVTYSDDLKWEPVGPLDENGKGIFVSRVYGDLQSKGPTYFLMRCSAGIKAPRHMHSGDYYAVVVLGRFLHYLESENECEASPADRLGSKRVTPCAKTRVWDRKTVFWGFFCPTVSTLNSPRKNNRHGRNKTIGSVQTAIASPCCSFFSERARCQL